MKLFSTLIPLFLSVVVFGQTDLSLLHAPPTQAEINAVKAEWATRDYSVNNWTVLHTGTLAGFTVEIVSHEVDGNTHYAAVRYPENYSPTGSYPVLVSNHGGASGVNVVSLNAYQETCYRSFFVALPSFRSEELRTSPIATTNYISGGSPSEMDGDTDDALGLLSGVLAIPGADANRICVTGGSRGGGVSHLMAAKDDRIKQVSLFYGATDHMALPGLQQKMEDYVDNGGGLNPPQANTYTYGVEPYLNGTLSLADARLALLRRSVRYFVDELPLPYQVHHGDADPVVTVDHSQLLAAEFANQGISTPDFEYFEYAGATHSLPNSTGAPTSRDAFLCQLSNINLPIRLIDFTGECREERQEVVLKWTAFVEEASGIIDLEWSSDAITWRSIETFDISQSYNQFKDFSFVDKGFSKGDNYYRIKETDISGIEEIHPIVHVMCDKNSVVISPNPSQGKIRINWNTLASQNKSSKIQIFNINGEKVLEREILRDTPSTELDLSNLVSGIYTCHILLDRDWVSQKIVLTRF